MKISIKNVDIKPYRVEFELPETSTAYPYLRVSSAGYMMDHLRGLPTGGELASITIRPSSLMEIALLSEDMIAKKLTGNTEKILKSSDSSKGKIRIINKKTDDVIETAIPEKDSRLYLVNGATDIICISPISSKGFLDIFLMNGSIWLADDVNTEMCIMSSEKSFDVDAKRFTYYDSPF